MCGDCGRFPYLKRPLDLHALKDRRPHRSGAACELLQNLAHVGLLANVWIFVVPATGGGDDISLRRQQIVLLSESCEQPARRLRFDLAASAAPQAFSATE